MTPPPFTRQAAEAELVELAPLLRSVASRYEWGIGDPMLDVEDLVAAAQAGVFTALMRWDPSLWPGTFRGYVCAAAEYAIKELLKLRRRSRHSAVGTVARRTRQHVGVEPLQYAMVTHDGGDAVEDREVVTRLLSVLPRREREVVRATYLHGLTAEEYGRKRGVSGAYIRQIRQRALSCMRAEAVRMGLVA